MGWGKKKIDIEDIDKKIEEYSFLVGYHKLLKQYVLDPIEDQYKNNTEYVVYKKYIELGNVSNVMHWLNDNNYKHLDRKFTTEMVSNLIDLIVPDVPPIINYLAKSLRYESPFYSIDYWWERWDGQQFNYQVEKISWQFKPFTFSLNDDIRENAKSLYCDMRDSERLYYSSDAQQKREARELLTESFNKNLRPLYDKALENEHILKQELFSMFL